MTLCLVTDRHRLCGGNAPFEVARRRLIEQALAAIQAGVDLIQVREPDLEAGELKTVVDDIVGVSRGTATRVVVNDRLDVALACGADGVHLRSDSIPAADARRMAPSSFFVGRSVHTADEAIEAGAVDYLIAGTVFPTASKPAGRQPIGLEGLRAIVAAACAPVLAIGGVTADRLADIAASGAAGVAAIGLFTGGAPLGALVDACRTRFDSRNSAP